MKIILTKENYFSHIGTDPVDNVIEFNDKWNIDNLPTQKHKWNGKDFILDKDKVLPYEKEERLKEIYARLDHLVFEAGKNDLFYKDVDQSTLKITYENKKAAILKERDELIIELEALTS